MEEREELFKLFEGCQAVGETSDALDAFRALKKVEIEELMNRVEIPAADFSDYYPHFLILLVLDFLEELVQSQEALARMPEGLMATGRLVPEMSTEISVNGKSLVCSKDRAQFGVKGNPVSCVFRFEVGALVCLVILIIICSTQYYTIPKVTVFMGGNYHPPMALGLPQQP